LLLGLLADTHIPDVAKGLPYEIQTVFRGVDLILHAGDIYVPSVLDDLQRIAPVLAAQGDDDGNVFQDPRVKPKHVLQLAGKTIWLVHDRAYYLSFPLSPWWRNESGEPNKIMSNRPDILVFGHEHRSVVEYVDGVLFVNPGSPTFLNYRQGPGTVGLLNIDSGKVEAHIVHLNGQ
jgi:putative phosphoesterase